MKYMRIQEAIDRIEKCNGDCHNCKHIEIATAPTEYGACYAHYCGIAFKAGFRILSESRHGLKPETISSLVSELPFEGNWS
jgi:hypothetical protein